MRKEAANTIPVLTESIKSILMTFSNSRSLPASLKQRSQIVLLASEGCPNQVIAEKTGLHYNNVAVWRNRFLEALPLLKEMETVAPEKLSDEIQAVFKDRHRSGRPSVFTQEQITKIKDLARKAPSDYGYKVSRWSLSLLAAEIKRQGIAEQISAKSVSRFLKANAVKGS